MKKAEIVFASISVIIAQLIHVKVIILHLKEGVEFLHRFQVFKNFHLALFLLIKQLFFLWFLKLLQQLPFIIIENLFCSLFKLLKLGFFLLFCKPNHNSVIHRKIFDFFQLFDNHFAEHAFDGQVFVQNCQTFRAKRVSTMHQNPRKVIIKIVEPPANDTALGVE